MSLIQKKSHSKYKVNHNLFQEDTEKSFYLAGFIAADGCIRIAKTNKSRNYINHRIQISLSQDDKSHLEMIRDLLESTNPIHNYLIENSKKNPKWNDVWESKLLITSKQLVTDLERFNVVPRKSLTYTFPDWLKNHPLKNHFMRGYFDGDGSFFINSELSYDRLCCSIRGTKNFLLVYKSILNNECGDGGSLDKYGKISQLRFKGKQVIKIRDFLYADSTICLDRKNALAYSIR